MTRTTWAGTCGAIVAAAAVTVLAQQPPPPPAQTSAASPNQITVTGCLKAEPSSTAEAACVAGTTGTTGTTGTAGTAGTTGTTPNPADEKFVLTNATIGAAAPPSTEAGAAGTTAGATAGAQASSSAQTYRLVANPAALSPHVGKKVELTGELDKGASSGADASPALRVQKGKVIAASCEP